MLDVRMLGDEQHGGAGGGGPAEGVTDANSVGCQPQGGRGFSLGLCLSVTLP